jgi:hypothetical protein
MPSSRERIDPITVGPTTLIDPKTSNSSDTWRLLDTVTEESAIRSSRTETDPFNTSSFLMDTLLPKTARS